MYIIGVRSSKKKKAAKQNDLIDNYADLMRTENKNTNMDGKASGAIQGERR